MDCDCKSCGKDNCPSRDGNKLTPEQEKMMNRLKNIKHCLVVLSGKGGVGKSTVSVNLAAALAREGYSVGLLDVDLHGPSIPTMLRLQDAKAVMGENGIEPIEAGPGLKVMSVAFFLEDQAQAVVWRGPMKLTAIKQMLEDVDWGELDYLIIDCPPGTGDEPLAVIQLIPCLEGGIIVTTPQEVAASDVRRSVTFCDMLHLPIVGVVENMSGFHCPDCDKTHYIFKQGGGKALAESMSLSFLGAIPIEPQIAAAGDSGTPFVNLPENSAAATAFKEIVGKIIR
jgi:Mrp family chromosome partitioning ATPase